MTPFLDFLEHLSYLYVTLQFFNKSFTCFLNDAADCLLGNFEEVLQANLRITACKESQRQFQTFLNRNGFPERCVFFDIFSPIKLIRNSNSLGYILVKFLYNPLPD